MPTPDEARDALRLVTSAAAKQAADFTASLTGSPEERRLLMLDGIPGLISYYADGSASLAADFYDDERDRLGITGRFTAVSVVEDRTVTVRRAIAWSAQPYFDGDGDVEKRIAGIVQHETATPYRDTILENSRRDPQSIGWKRNAGDSCAFCRMAADKGAVYKRETATFAAHEHCDCTAVQVFRDLQTGPEASALQYIGAKRRRTPAEKARLREFLEGY